MFSFQYCIGIAFAQALKASDSKIEQQICKAGKKKNGNSNQGGNCNGNTTYSSGAQADPGLVAAITNDGTGKWPLINANTSNPAVEDGTKTVANDIIAMSKDDKSIVAGHLAKSIEGGEVVEIRPAV